MKYKLSKVIANEPGRWESFLFITNANYDNYDWRPEMYFAYVKENVLAINMKTFFCYIISLYLMVPYIFYW